MKSFWIVLTNPGIVLVLFIFGGLFVVVESNEHRAKKETDLREVGVVNHYGVALHTNSNQLGVVMVNASGVTVVPRDDISGTKIAVVEWWGGDFHRAKRVIVYVRKDSDGKQKEAWDKFLAQLRMREKDWRSRTYPRDVLPPDNIAFCGQPTI